jgi:glucose-6-phosphate dehydrogenase assembly protein OpcA
VHAVEREGRAVCFEEVVLRVRGPARHHLDSVVEPFALPDVPMVVWLPAGLPSPGDPLMRAANRVVVDSRAVAEAGGDVLIRSAALAKRLPVVDLSWTRMEQWRSMLAGLFEGGVYRPFLDAVDGVEVCGNHGPRYLLGGWLMRRLNLPPARVALQRADHLSVVVHAVSGGRKGKFSVTRKGAEREITSCVDIEDGPQVEQTVRMREQWPSLALASALTRFGHDESYEEALAGARDLRLAEGGE